MTLVIFSTPFCRPSEQTPKHNRITPKVTGSTRPALLTIEPNTLPRASTP